MASKQVRLFANQILVFWKLCLSFRKRNWELEDYPVSIRRQEVNKERVGTQYERHRYMAYIVNWALAGTGYTREAAIYDLKTKFKASGNQMQEEGRHLPRPGVRVPLEWASQEHISKHGELADDFVRRVLDLEWAWISDESSLWDFHTDETNGALFAKIMEIYGVDASDIESANLSEILDRIVDKRISD